MNRSVTVVACLLAGTLIFPFTALAQGSFPEVNFGGRLQLDYTYFDNDKYDYDSGGEVRRGRLFARGSLASDWQFKLQVDFAPDDPELKDGYLQYTGFDNARVWVGNFKQPSGLEQLTSSNNITFTERSLVNSLQEGRRMGVAYQRWGEQTTLMLSAFGDEANGLVEGSGVAGRFVYHPQLSGERVLHFGISAARSEDEDDKVRFRTRPESHQDGHRIISTGAILHVDKLLRTGLEAAYVDGRFSAQAEFVDIKLSRRGGSDLSFSGYYAYASYFLTNDSRAYKANDGAFDKVDPNSSGGAWELALRFSRLDLTDGGIRRGEAATFTLGLNYYATPNLRFMANYVAADSDMLAGNDDPNSLQLRMQITF